MAGARPVFADIDRGASDDRSGGDRAPRSRRARGRSCRCTCTASRPTWPRIERDRRARTTLADRRGLLSGAPRDGGRTAGRHDRRRRRLQLLPDEEPRRARRRRRGRHERRARSPTASGGCATADRPIATTTRSPASTRGSTRCRPRSCARGCRFSRLDRAAARARGCVSRRLLAGAPVRRAPAKLDAGHVYHLFVVATARRRDALQQHLATAGIETLVHYPVPIPRQPAFARRPAGRCPARPTARATQVLSLPLHPALDASRRRRGRARRRASFQELTDDARAHHRRRRLHRIASRRSAARRRPRGAGPRQSVDRLDRQHRASEGTRRASSTSSTRSTTSRCSPS